MALRTYLLTLIMGIYNPPVIAPNMFDKGSVIEVVDASWSIGVVYDDDFPLAFTLDTTTVIDDIDRDSPYTIVHYDKPCFVTAVVLSAVPSDETVQLQKCQFAIHRINADGTESHSLTKIAIQEILSYPADSDYKYVMFGPMANNVGATSKIDEFGTMWFQQQTWFPNGVKITANFTEANQTDPIVFGWVGSKYEWPS